MISPSLEVTSDLDPQSSNGHYTAPKRVTVNISVKNLSNISRAVSVEALVSVVRPKGAATPAVTAPHGHATWTCDFALGRRESDDRDQPLKLDDPLVATGESPVDIAIDFNVTRDVQSDDAAIRRQAFGQAGGLVDPQLFTLS